MIRNILFLISIFSFTACANSFPASSCNDKYWLEFSLLKFCLQKNNVSSVNVMNSDLPSMSLIYDNNEYIFMKQLAENVNGNLHLKYNLTLTEYFSALANGTERFDIKTAFEVHELKSVKDISELSYGDWRVYTLISTTRSFDEIFILNTTRKEFIYHIGGEFNKTQALKLISLISFPKI